MCDLAGSRLIAWMDGEVEDAGLQSHVAGCAECSGEVRRIRRLSGEISAYCEAVSSGRKHRRRWWIPLAAAAAVLIAALGLLSMARPPVRTPITISDSGEPAVLVVVPLDRILPVGAAPAGAVLVGKLTFDAAGRPNRLTVE